MPHQFEHPVFVLEIYIVLKPLDCLLDGDALFHGPNVFAFKENRHIFRSDNSYTSSYNNNNSILYHWPHKFEKKKSC